MFWSHACIFLIQVDLLPKILSFDRTKKNTSQNLEEIVLPTVLRSSSHRVRRHEQTAIPHTIPPFSRASGIFWLKCEIAFVNLLEIDLPTAIKTCLDLRFVFQNQNNKLFKGSKTTYAQWAEKHGFMFAHRHIPQSWLEGETDGRMATWDATR